MKFKSLKNRLMTYFFTAMLVVLLSVFIAFDFANTNNAKGMIVNALQVTVNTLDNQLTTRSRHLLEATRILSGDFAFKQAFFTRDYPTIRSAMENHQNRIGADLIMLADLEGEVIASTRALENADDQPQLRIIEEAQMLDTGHAHGMIFVSDQLYQVVAVPLLAPIPKGWFLVGFQIDQTFIEKLKNITLADISFITQLSDQKPRMYKSSLNQQYQADLLRMLDNTLATNPELLILNGNQFVTQYIPLEKSDGMQVYVFIQRSLDKALAPFKQIRHTLVLIIGFLMILAIIMINVMSRNIVRPVNHLAQTAKKIEGGDYQGEVPVTHADEIGELQQAFSLMMQGLREKDKVRNLLGKVVSEEIAEELLSSDIELGGEEKTVSILFSDIRSFTTLSEQYSPREMLAILNEYLSSMSLAIESNGGVIDKFIGDAIMALFGAPLSISDSVNKSVASALAMQQALAQLNQAFKEKNWPELSMGIGINTGTVIAGNMGSNNRLNYTVIGDGVNLASRVEGLCKYYGVGVIITQTTADGASDYLHREIDRVRVKGKQAPVSIYEPIEIKSTEEEKILSDYHKALALYRSQQWELAHRAFGLLDQCSPHSLYTLYQSRIAHFQQQSPGKNWDGTFIFETK